MRNRFEKLNQEDTKIDITPMLDVVFIMLIFFIVTATFVNETGFNFDKPEVNPTPPVDAAENILISIDPNNEIYIKGRQIDIRKLTANVKYLHSENSEAVVVIQASKLSKNNTMVKVIDSVHGANIKNPVIAASIE